MTRRRFPNLKAYLEHTGTSQGAFARRMGVDKALVSRVANRKAGIPLRRALEWAAAARVPVESFVMERESR
jgi:transcriptional regulator with XRE-family HTH domain